MQAAFATDPTKNIGEAISLVRKASSAPDEEVLDGLMETKLEKKSSTLATDTTLNKLMSEGFAAEILIGTEFSQLSAHLITLVSQII